MAMKAKSKEELAMAKLRMNIIEKMEQCVKESCEETAYRYASILQVLPTYIDYRVNE